MLWSIGSLFLWLVWKLELDCDFSVRNYKHSRGLVRYSDVTIEPKLFTLYSVGGWSQPLPCAIHWIAFNDIKPIRSLGGDVTLPVLQEKNDLTFFPLPLSTLGTTMFIFGDLPQITTPCVRLSTKEPHNQAPKTCIKKGLCVCQEWRPLSDGRVTKA